MLEHAAGLSEIAIDRAAGEWLAATRGVTLAGDEPTALGKAQERRVDIVRVDRGDLLLAQFVAPKAKPRKARLIKLPRGHEGLDHNLKQCHFGSPSLPSTTTLFRDRCRRGGAVSGFRVKHLPKSGAGKESRTPDLNLGKVALYQLSYSRTGHEL